MQYRIIALDLDGTTLDSGGRIRARTRQAVAAVRQKGAEVVLVTGRHHSVTRPFHDELGLASPAICCNGTYVYDFASDRAVSGAPMAADDARFVVATCQRHRVEMLLYTGQTMFFQVLTPHIKKLLAWIAGLDTRPRPELSQAADFSAVVEAAPTIWKFVMTHADAGRLAACHDEIRGTGRFSIEYSWHDRVDVMPAGMSKGARLIDWAAGRGIAPAEIIAFGDNCNDMEMLTAVGRGIAMGNAPDVVKAVAAETIGTNDTDAIAEALARLF